MDVILHRAAADDEPFLWSMLFEAARAADDGYAGPDDLRAVPALARYVEGWGRPTDLGVVAVDDTAGGAAARGPGLGAAWVRLLRGEEAGYGFVDDETPELAIAVNQGRRARGLGGLMLAELLAAARTRFPGVCLSVRADNPARRLYERTGFRAVDGSDMTGGDMADRLAGTSITMVVRF
jgi:GNAT superfamily N-acetyltransferase